MNKVALILTTKLPGQPQANGFIEIEIEFAIEIEVSCLFDFDGDFDFGQLTTI